MRELRDDLALAAYAVSIGYELRGHLDAKLAQTVFAEDGIPPDSLQFIIGDVYVWSTARGQHVAYLKATQARPLALAMDEQIKKANIAPPSFMRPTKLVRSPNSGYPMAEVEA